MQRDIRKKRKRDETSQLSEKAKAKRMLSQLSEKVKLRILEKIVSQCPEARSIISSEHARIKSKPHLTMPCSNSEEDSTDSESVDSVGFQNGDPPVGKKFICGNMSSGPSIFEKVCEAIDKRKDFMGCVSRSSIYEYFGIKYPGIEMPEIQGAISKGLEDGRLEELFGSNKIRRKVEVEKTVSSFTKQIKAMQDQEEPSKPIFTVKDCGMVEFNGKYYLDTAHNDGFKNGKRCYRKNGVGDAGSERTIEWKYNEFGGGYWYMAKNYGTSYYYHIYSDAEQPPTSGWKVNFKGLGSPPQLMYEGNDAGNGGGAGSSEMITQTRSQVSNPPAEEEFVAPVAPEIFVKICAAINKRKVDSSRGVSRAAIYKYIGDNYPGTKIAAVRLGLANGIEHGYFANGVTTQRFKITPAGEEKLSEY